MDNEERLRLAREHTTVVRMERGIGDLVVKGTMLALEAPPERELIAGLTTMPSRRQALRDQVQWIAELAKCTIEAPHDRTRFEDRLARLRAALETEPVVFAKEEGR